jgi:hypothetical protein
VSGVRGVTAQEQLENQDPSVLFRINEVTGEVTPIAAPEPASVEQPAKRRGRPPKKVEPVEEATDDVPAEGAGE